MQYEQLRSSTNCEVIVKAWKEIVQQLPVAAAHACRRAERQGRDHTPELHVLVSCRKSRHRAEMFSEWADDAFTTFLDVGSVEVVKHHLRSGPHDPRGRCGCPLDNCGAFRERDKSEGQHD